MIKISLTIPVSYPVHLSQPPLALQPNSVFSKHKLQSIPTQNATLALWTSITFLFFSLHFDLSIFVLALASYIQ